MPINTKQGKARQGKATQEETRWNKHRSVAYNDNDNDNNNDNDNINDNHHSMNSHGMKIIS